MVAQISCNCGSRHRSDHSTKVKKDLVEGENPWNTWFWSHFAKKRIDTWYESSRSQTKEKTIQAKLKGAGCMGTKKVNDDGINLRRDQQSMIPYLIAKFS